MAADLLSFGAFHIMNPGWIALRLAGEIANNCNRERSTREPW
jgi:hypothetical protein